MSKKILMVLERDFPPDVRVEHEIDSLTKAGFEVHLACFTKTNRPFEENWNGAFLHRKPMSEFVHKTGVGCLKFPFYFNWWRSFLKPLCKKYNFDAIHIHDLPLAQVGYELSKDFGLRFILDLHENWPALLEVSPHVKTLLGRLLSSDKQWREYERDMVMKADDVITVVDENRDRLLLVVEDTEKLHVVSNTPTLKDIQDFSNSKQNESESDNMILFYGGGVTEHRGLQYVLRALADLNKQNIEFWVVGDGSYLNDLKSLSAELKITDKVRFWGWKSLDELKELMLRSHVLIIPHMESGHTNTTIPHKLFQYMATGKPILATDCIPIRRILIETASGTVYKSSDIQEIRSRIRELSSAFKKDGTLKTDGPNHVKKTYNWSRDEQKLLTIYQSI